MTCQYLVRLMIKLRISFYSYIYSQTSPKLNFFFFHFIAKSASAGLSTAPAETTESVSAAANALFGPPVATSAAAPEDMNSSGPIQ